MISRVKRNAIKSCLAGMLCAVALSAHGQSYPDKQVQVIVPYPPGGTTDFVARLISKELAEKWQQPVVILNKPGASGALGAEQAARSKGDGYTLLITGYENRLLLFAPELPKPDPATDLVPVTLVGKAPLILLANPDFPAKTLEDLIKLAKEKPESLNYASIGAGSPSHLAMEDLKEAAGIKLTHVPYKGSGPALLDVMSGHVPVMFDSSVSASPHVKSGKLRAIATAAAERMPSLPDVPTVAESGVPGFNASTWIAMYAPAGTPPEVVSKIHADVGEVLKTPQLIHAYSEQGAVVPETMPPAQVAEFIGDDIVRWRKVIQAADIKLEN